MIVCWKCNSSSQNTCNRVEFNDDLPIQSLRPRLGAFYTIALETDHACSTAHEAMCNRDAVSCGATNIVLINNGLNSTTSTYRQKRTLGNSALT